MPTHLYRNVVRRQGLLDICQISPSHDLVICLFFSFWPFNMGRLNDDESLAGPLLLDKIDKLFACNVGEYIDLPQLVVVGDQSSGKSSVLEGLSRLAFPRDSGLCTRFATQIIFRRTENTGRNITASIIPDGHIDSERASQLRDWKAQDLQDLRPDNFSRIMSEASHWDLFY